MGSNIEEVIVKSIVPDAENFESSNLMRFIPMRLLPEVGELNTDPFTFISERLRWRRFVWFGLLDITKVSPPLSEFIFLFSAITKACS